MTRRFLLGMFLAALSMLALVGAGILLFRSLGFSIGRRGEEQRRTRVVIPRDLNSGGGRDSAEAERMAWEDSLSAKLPLEEGEIIISVLTQDFDGDASEEQIIAYRNLLEIDSPIYLAFIDYDEKSKDYKRRWNTPTAATRQGTISLYTKDLVGDRSVCVILTGMNGSGEHTMTIFRKNPPSQARNDEAFLKIAELRIDGSIVVQETERSQAYHMGITKGQSFTIAAYGHNYESANILDQLETVYAFNQVNGLYEQSKVSRIPGALIEQRRLRELLSGAPGVFEGFINDLWYYVSPQGTLDNRQYIYFDPASRELIFFGDETQQVFTWQNSSPTRYGLYISSQNISVTTLRRFIDIELESLDSIRIKVFEDVRLKIGVSAAWDGSYRRAGALSKAARGAVSGAIKTNIEALYDSSLGRMRFFPDGGYELSSGGSVKKGRYVFFLVNGQELLELRPDQGKGEQGREIYLVQDSKKEEKPGSRGILGLSKVRLGANGIEDLHEGLITLTPAESNG
jgi:hypothetical protein